MEGKSVLHSIAIFFLAFSIVVGSWLISSGIRSAHTSALPIQNHLMTQQQVASYLGLSVQEVGELMSTPGQEIDNELPHLHINHKNYFDEKAVTNWVQKYQVLNLP